MSLHRIMLSIWLVTVAGSISVFAATQSGVTVNVDPMSVTLPVGSTRQLTAKVTGSANTAVSWTVSGITGSNLPTRIFNRPISFQRTFEVTPTRLRKCRPVFRMRWAARVGEAGPLT
jgi:hypothetical protein